MVKKHSEKRKNSMLRATPFRTVFSKDLYCRHVKTRACLGKGLNLYHTIPTFNHPQQRRLLKTLCEKRENAGNQHLLLFPQSFPPFPKQISSFQPHLICCLQMLPFWTSLQICTFVMGQRWPSRCRDKNFTKILKNHPNTPKAFKSSFIKPQ